jgi:hypothetical protein
MAWRVYLQQRTYLLTVGTAVECQSTKSLCDSGEVGLGLSIIPRGEVVGSGGSTLS